MFVVKTYSRVVCVCCEVLQQGCVCVCVKTYSRAVCVCVKTYSRVVCVCVKTYSRAVCLCEDLQKGCLYLL